MTRTLKLPERLEEMVDDYSLPTVLEILADVCLLKETHINENWQDEQTARYWRRCSIDIRKCKLQIQELLKSIT